MLVLTRHVGEEILIGTDIRIVLVATDRGTARLGIAAPRSVAVARVSSHPPRRPGKEFTTTDKTPPSGRRPSRVLGS